MPKLDTEGRATACYNAALSWRVGARSMYQDGTAWLGILEHLPSFMHHDTTLWAFSMQLGWQIYPITAYVLGLTPGFLA